MTTTVKVEGFAELDRALGELPKATSKNVLRRTARTAMLHIEGRAKDLVPVQEGDLRDSITTKNAKARRVSRTRYAQSDGVEVWTGPTGRQAGGNAAWQEYGTVHMAAQPYMRPAADVEADNVIAEVRDELKKQIEKAKARIARKMLKGK